jgi:hypothetical protein
MLERREALQTSTTNTTSTTSITRGNYLKKYFLKKCDPVWFLVVFPRKYTIRAPSILSSSRPPPRKKHLSLTFWPDCQDVGKALKHIWHRTKMLKTVLIGRSAETACARQSVSMRCVPSVDMQPDKGLVHTGWHER